METPHKFTIADLSIRKLESPSVLIIIISTDEDPSLVIESLAIINLRCVSTKLYFNLIFAMQTCKELITLVTCVLKVVSFHLLEDKYVLISTRNHACRSSSGNS